jgi:hypothetical protein
VVVEFKGGESNRGLKGDFYGETLLGLAVEQAAGCERDLLSHRVFDRRD